MVHGRTLNLSGHERYAGFTQMFTNHMQMILD